MEEHFEFRATLLGDRAAISPVYQFAAAIGIISDDPDPVFEVSTVGAIMLDLTRLRKEHNSINVELDLHGRPGTVWVEMKVDADGELSMTNPTFLAPRCPHKRVVYIPAIVVSGDGTPDWGTRLLRSLRDVLQGSDTLLVLHLGGPDASDYVSYFFKGHEALGLRVEPNCMRMSGIWHEEEHAEPGAQISVAVQHGSY